MISSYTLGQLGPPRLESVKLSFEMFDFWGLCDPKSLPIPSPEFLCDLAGTFEDFLTLALIYGGVSSKFLSSF